MIDSKRKEKKGEKLYIVALIAMELLLSLLLFTRVSISIIPRYFSCDRFSSLLRRYERFYYVVVHRGSSVKFDLYGDDTRYPSRCVEKRKRGDIRPNVSFSNSIPIRTNRGN